MNLFILFNCSVNKKLGDVYTLPSVTATPADAYLSDGISFLKASMGNIRYANWNGKPSADSSTEGSSTEVSDMTKPGGSEFVNALELKGRIVVGCAGSPYGGKQTLWSV